MAKPRQPMRVVIADGGVAAIEALLALRELAGEYLDLTVVSPEREFVYRPVTVAEAFDRGEARVYPLAEIASQASATLVVDSLEHVEPGAGKVQLQSTASIGYDYLIVAAGALAREPLPAERMRTLPIYELALMTGSHLREHGSGAQVWLATPEDEPLELFGPAAAQAILPMLQSRQVRLRTSALAAEVRHRSLALAGGGDLCVDRVVTLPALEGPGLAGLPQDRHGFIPVDGHGRVRGLRRVFAAGDVTAFPLKQGGLAAQQADAAAEAIAAEIGLPLTPQPFRPVLRGLLLTGGAPLYLRAEPQRRRRAATVAIDAAALPHRIREASAAAGQALWWPPAKIAGRYLAPFLATARPQPLSSELLSDRVAAPGAPLPAREFDDALQLALLLADCDGRWGDYAAALNALDAAEALQGAIPPEYEHKRRQWRAALRTA